jgi:hypothetical protein
MFSIMKFLLQAYPCEIEHKEIPGVIGIILPAATGKEYKLQLLYQTY